MRIAITRKVSASICDCELLHIDRAEIDYHAAEKEHQEYERYLSSRGFTVISLPEKAEMPDAAFVEDVAIVLDELAISAPMGSGARKAERSEVVKVLSCFREVCVLPEDAQLEGGDVLTIGKRIFVGRSSRTDEAGIDCLAQAVGALGYSVTPVEVGNCLHLKTACSFIGNNTLLVNDQWIDIEPLRDFDLVRVSEPWAANVLFLDSGELLLARTHSETGRLLASHGFSVHSLDVSELSKAEAGLTCLSIIFSL